MLSQPTAASFNFADWHRTVALIFYLFQIRYHHPRVQLGILAEDSSARVHRAGPGSCRPGGAYLLRKARLLSALASLSARLHADITAVDTGNTKCNRASASTR